MANPNIVNVTTIQAGNAGWALGTGLTTVLLTVGADVVVKVNAIYCDIQLFTDICKLVFR